MDVACGSECHVVCLWVDVTSRHRVLGLECTIMLRGLSVGGSEYSAMLVGTDAGAANKSSAVLGVCVPQCRSVVLGVCVPRCRSVVLGVCVPQCWEYVFHSAGNIYVCTSTPPASGGRRCF